MQFASILQVSTTATHGQCSTCTLCVSLHGQLLNNVAISLYSCRLFLEDMSLGTRLLIGDFKSEKKRGQVNLIGS